MPPPEHNSVSVIYVMTHGRKGWGLFIAITKVITSMTVKGQKNRYNVN